LPTRSTGPSSDPGDVRPGLVAEARAAMEFLALVIWLVLALLVAPQGVEAVV
jgi:hypothetical protein